MKKITNYVMMITAVLLLSFVHLNTSAQCTYSVKLYDTWGDGWNGGILDVFVNGSLVIDNATLPTGSGPATYNFTVNTGNMITTDYTAGSWSSENYYQIYNAVGLMVYGTPAGSTPVDLVAPGITANCPPPVGNVTGHVYNGDGVPIAGAEVGAEGYGFRITDAMGAYTFLGLPAGPNELYASKDGWNTIYQTVTVISSNTVTLDFTLTRPSLTVNPLLFDEILNPNEYLTKFLGMLNIGDGPAGWSAVVNYPEVVINNVESTPVVGVGEPSTGRIPEGLQQHADNRAPQYLNPDDSYNAWIFGPNGGSPSTLYIADMGTYTYTTVGTSLVDPSSGDFMNNETTNMYCAGNWGTTLYSVNVSNGVATMIAPFTGGFDDVSGMAVDRTTNTMYVCMTNISASQIGTLNVETGAITLIGSSTTTAPGLIQIAIDGSGQMYGWDIVTDNSYLIDKATGAVTLLGSLGFDANYGQGGNWSSVDDVIYLTAFNNGTFQGELRALDVTTGGTAFLGVLPQLQCTAFGVPGSSGGGVSGWLTLGQYEGEVGPNGTSFNLPVNFDATGTEAGQVYNAEIVVSTDPNVGTFTIPVTMTIYGDPLAPVTDLTATITNEVTGTVELNWSFNRPVNFQYFLIKRDGLGVGTSTTNSFGDVLPGYDTYCYTVTPVFDAGNGVPGGPACVDWLIPVLCYSPSHPMNEQWPMVEENVMLTLENCGEGTLEFSFPDYAAQLLLNNPDIQKNDVSPIEAFERMAEPAKGETDPRDGGGHPIVLGAGGPDTFGYEWIDSDESGGPVFNWIEISTIGTQQSLSGDDASVSIPLPFAFPFYGVNKTSLLASTNGYLTFGSTGSDYSNDAIPNSAQPNDIIALFWDDLNFTGTAKLFTYNDVANNRFIIEYQNVPRLSNDGLSTYQAILTANGGITIQYLSVNGTLNSATIGIENAAGNDGLQVAYNTSYMANGKAIYFFQPAHFITAVNPYYGTISEGNSVDVTLTYSSEDYGVGTYNEDLFISTNEQGPNEWMIPNTMVVYQPASISGTVTDCVTGAPKKNVTVTAYGQQAINEWLYYDNGVFDDGIGGPGTFSWAIKFDPAQLTAYEGTALTKIMLYNYVTSPGQLRIYQGTNAATLLHSQNLTGLPVGNWSEVDLTMDVPLDITQELWITVYTTVGATFPASACVGQGVPNGDLITLDGVNWGHLTGYGLNYTWTLRGFVTDAAGTLAALPMETPKDNYDLGSRTNLASSGNTVNVPIPEQFASRVPEVNTYTTETAENGTYTLVVDPGTYNVEFTKVGYHDVLVEDVIVTVPTSPVDVDAVMCEMAYPVSFVHADPNEADTQALITWGIPMGPYSIIYDDGTAENYFSWLSAGSASAVKFTPAGYPATVIGGRMFVGDGSFPEGVDFLGAEVAVGVIAADGTNGLPGTVLDSTIVTVDNYGWVNFDNVFNTTIDAGNFYIAVWKLFTQVPVGVDQNVPTYYRSYVKPVGGNWAASSYQDFMIRAIVDGPGTNVAERTSGVMIYPAKPNMTDFVATCTPSGTPGVEKTGIYVAEPNQEASRELVDYAVARISGFDPNTGETPEDGTMTEIAAHNATQSFNDVGFGAQPAGFYAYAVRANYSLENSTWVYSNVVAHGLDNVVTLNVSRCDGGDVSGAEVHLIGRNYPYQHLMATTDVSGIIVFDSVINGIYDLSAYKFGFQPYNHDGILINYDYTEDVVLANKTYPAKNLMVEPLTSVATWEPPMYIAVDLQNFEDATFPPAGWIKESNSRGFFRTNAGGSSFWPIPAGDGYYACTNDDGFNGDASIDRLITPACDLREGAEYSFTFDYFYDGSWGGSAYVEYSLDGGASWTEMMTLGAVNDWTTESISLASFASESAIKFCFHYDDNGFWADGSKVQRSNI
jgi:hypothetical protein